MKTVVVRVDTSKKLIALYFRPAFDPNHPPSADNEAAVADFKSGKRNADKASRASAKAPAPSQPTVYLGYLPKNSRRRLIEKNQPRGWLTIHKL